MGVDETQVVVAEGKDVHAHLVFILEGVYKRRALDCVLEVYVEVHRIGLLVHKPVLADWDELPFLVKPHDHDSSQLVASSAHLVVLGGDHKHILLFVHPYRCNLLDKTLVCNTRINEELTDLVGAPFLDIIHEHLDEPSGVAGDYTLIFYRCKILNYYDRVLVRNRYVKSRVSDSPLTFWGDFPNLNFLAVVYQKAGLAFVDSHTAVETIHALSLPHDVVVVAIYGRVDLDDRITLTLYHKGLQLFLQEDSVEKFPR